VTQRSYHSIGDVLTLLRAEFPDITISKIRFLESQGLVSPQRSPSGYRKFYDEDIERLRYVLVQQREHFLPLKVIRDRLNGDEPTDPEEPVDRDSDAASGANGSSSAQATSPEPVSAQSSGPTKQERSSRQSVPAIARGGEGDPKPASRTAAREPSISDVVAALQEAPSPRAEPRPPRRPPAHAAPPSEPDPVVEGETLTPEELADKLGLDVSYIDALVEFGVITPVNVGGMVCFDEGNVSLAGIAAGFAAFGVEPRHLRQFRTSVDRELGLIDQIISPLLRQRNPEARAKAGTNAKELAKLGRDMRATLIAQELRKLFQR
jgi:DNA-binding transcriptional MerR regulator